MPPARNLTPKDSLTGCHLLIIFAKEPVPGEVKTRLCPPLSPQAAARLYAQFLSDVLEEMRGLSELKIALAYTPDSARPFFENLAAPDIYLVPQTGEDLGERLRRAFDWGFAQGAETVLIRNSDSPDLPGWLVTEAQNLLEQDRDRVVVGPCPDGGYYLIGLKSPQPLLFFGITWSSPTVLADTLANAWALGLKVDILPPWLDIDTYDDLLAFLELGKINPGPGWRSFDLAKALLGGGPGT